MVWYLLKVLRENIPNLEFYTQQNYYSETKEKKIKRETLKEYTILRVFLKGHVSFAFSKKRNLIVGERFEKQVAIASKDTGKSKQALAINDNDKIVGRWWWWR